MRDLLARHEAAFETASMLIRVLVALAFLGVTRNAAGQTPENARAAPGGRGWVCDEGYVQRRNRCAPVATATDAEIRRMLIAESISAYPGSCPCPYFADRAGRSCGRRSAYSRPGGDAPLCYPGDVSERQVAELRGRYKAPQ